MSRTSKPGAPVGVAMFACGWAVHRERIRSTSVVASWKPLTVIGVFPPGTHGKTATPAAS